MILSFRTRRFATCRSTVRTDWMLVLGRRHMGHSIWLVWKTNWRTPQLGQV